MYRDAVFSPDGEYRYALVRSWADGPRDTWIMLNPSTADAEVDDPTIRRCIGFSRAWGAGGIRVVNLFALRATDPAELLRHPSPIGRTNDKVISTTIASSKKGRVVAAWGAHRMAAERGRAVAALITPLRAPLFCLGVTKLGYPRHPLYVAGNTPLVPWVPLEAS